MIYQVLFAVFILVVLPAGCTWLVWCVINAGMPKTAPRGQTWR